MFKFLNKLSIKILLFLLFFPQLIQAQLNNQLFEDRQKMKDDSRNQIFFHFNNLNFLRNNEYFNPVVSGETLFGYQVSPTFVYYPSQYLRLEGGVFAWQNFGNNKYTRISPIFSLKYKKDSTSVVFGNIEAHFNHRLTEPMYAFERVITNHLESGLQIQHHKKWIFFDTWIDWQRATQRSAVFQEELFAGVVSNFYPVNNEHFRIEIPVHATVFHQGGQDLAIPLPSRSHINALSGLNFHWINNPNNMIKRVRLDNYYVFSKSEILSSDSLNISEQSGSGLYHNLSLDSKWINFMASLWIGDKYNSIQGGELYRSFPVDRKGTFQQRRELLFLRFMKNMRLLPDLNFILRFEPYIDLKLNTIEYSFGFYMTYRPSFLIAKIGKKDN